MERTAVPCFAAIDLGTNNCRLLVATPSAGGFRVIDSFSRIVRLGEGLEETGRLDERAMGRAMEALQACADRLARRPVRGIRAIATEACRRASNGAAFLEAARRETGLPIDAISTREEAELALQSCASLLRGGGGRRALIFDIGGGSTEIAWVRLAEAAPPALIGYESLPIGVVTLAERYGNHIYERAAYEAMRDDVAARLLAFERTHCIGHEIRLGGVRMLGTSGTVTTLAGVALDLPRYRRAWIDGAVLEREAVKDAIATLRRLGREGLGAHPCIGTERADFVLPGCAIFEALREIWPVDEVMVADRGLREGMLLKMMHGAGARPLRTAALR